MMRCPVEARARSKIEDQRSSSSLADEDELHCGTVLAKLTWLLACAG